MMTSRSGKIIFLFALFLCLFLLQTGGILVFWGVGINLLILFSVLAGLSDLDAVSFGVLLMLELLTAWAWAPFWVIPFLVYPAVALCVFLFKKRLTGNRFLDYLIFLTGTSVVAFFLLSSSPMAVFRSPVLLYELAFNLIVGVLLWPIAGNRLTHHAKTARPF